jgi:molybdate transport system substrate-binding protein
VRVALEAAPGDSPRISYPLAVLRRARDLEAARRLAEFLGSPGARPVFEKFGFLWLPDPPRHDP